MTDTEQLDEQTTAALILIGKLGGRRFQVKKDGRTYVASALLLGQVVAERSTSAPDAAEALARRFLLRSTCDTCGRPIRLGGPEDHTVCRMQRIGPRWVKGTKCKTVTSAKRAAAARKKHKTKR